MSKSVDMVVFMFILYILSIGKRDLTATIQARRIIFLSQYLILTELSNPAVT